MGIMGLKSRCQQSSFWKIQERICFLALSSFFDSRTPDSNHIIPISALFITSLMVGTLPPYSFTFTEPTGYIGPIQKNQHSFPIFKIINLITSAKPLLPCKGTHSQGIRPWTAGGAVSLPDTRSVYLRRKERNPLSSVFLIKKSQNYLQGLLPPLRLVNMP